MGSMRCARPSRCRLARLRQISQSIAAGSAASSQRKRPLSSAPAERMLWASRSKCAVSRSSSPFNCAAIGPKASRQISCCSLRTGSAHFDFHRATAAIRQRLACAEQQAGHAGARSRRAKRWMSSGSSHWTSNAEPVSTRSRSQSRMKLRVRLAQREFRRRGRHATGFPASRKQPRQSRGGAAFCRKAGRRLSSRRRATDRRCARQSRHVTAATRRKRHRLDNTMQPLIDV